MIFPSGCTHWRGENPGRDYQRDIYDQALDECSNRRVAVDAGAHVGIFTTRMEADFETVLAFEPVPSNFACLKVNTSKALLFNCGLAMFGREAKMRCPAVTNSGSWEQHEEGETRVRMLALDDFDLKELDFFKLDIQGGEPSALRGATHTIARCKPVILCEYSGDNGLEIARILTHLGYRLKREMGDDRIWVP